MVKENEGVISFVPGVYADDGSKVLGRIVVHDRLEVEAKVLPRYFNHSSFASLRRQLNYFSFVRLGKGRQRESTYVNEGVVVMDDILHLKRRPATARSQDPGAASLKEKLYADLAAGPTTEIIVRSDGPVLDLATSEPKEETSKPLSHRQKRRKTEKSTSSDVKTTPRKGSPLQHLISEDDDDDVKHYIALDLTKPHVKPDEDVLEGCRSLLLLASRGW